MKIKCLRLSLLAIGLSLGIGCVSTASAKSLSSVPKNMRGTWYDKYNSKEIFKSRSLIETEYENGKRHVFRYHLATSNEGYKVKHSQRINTDGNGKVAIWWQLNGSNSSTVHPTYYRLTHRVFSGHSYQRLIEYSGSNFGIGGFSHYRIKNIY